MARIQWKAKHDALTAEHDATKRELELVTGLHETARGEIEALKQQIVDVDRRVERARILGALGLASSLLVPSEEIEADLRS